MKASLTFLGTGQGSLVIGKNHLSSGGIVLQVDENQFWLDPGPNALKNAAENNINIRATTAILVSHAHLGHSNDTNAIIDAMTYSGFDKKGVLIASKSVINGSNDFPPVLLPYSKTLLERYIAMEAGQMVGINDIEIKALKTKHSDQDAIGFKFFTSNFILAYSSDTKFAPELIDEYKGSNILILNVPSIKDPKANLCIEDAIKIIKEVKPKLAIITHFGTDMVKGDPLSLTRNIQMAAGVQVITAKDSMVINPLSYSVSQRIIPSKQEEKKQELPEVKPSDEAEQKVLESVRC